MNPVLAQQEIHAIERRRRELQADVERNQCLRIHGSRSRRISPATLHLTAVVGIWCRAVVGRAASCRPWTAAAVATKTTGTSS